MLNWLWKNITRAISLPSALRNRKKFQFDIDEFFAQRFLRVEAFIEQTDDFMEEADPSHPVRVLWNKTAYHLADYYRAKHDLIKAAHFYHKIKADSAFAVKAYYHLGNIYYYSFNNPQAGAHYFRLGKEKGDLQCGLLEKLANYKLSQLFGVTRPLSDQAQKDNNLSLTSDKLADIEQLQQKIYSQGEKEMERKGELLVQHSSEHSFKLPNKIDSVSPQKPIQQDKEIPAHLLAFYSKPLTNPIHKESPFLTKMAEIVTNYRKVLEDERSTIFVKAWQIRMKEVEALEEQIRIARSTDDDCSVYELCIQIANQENIYPFGFFSRNEFPESIASLLEDVIQGEVDIHLHGLIGDTEMAKQHEELKKEVEQLNRQLHVIQTTQKIPTSQNLDSTLELSLQDKKQQLTEMEDKLKATESKVKLAEEKLVGTTQEVMKQNKIIEKINEKLKQKFNESHLARKFYEHEETIQKITRERDQMMETLKAYQDELLKQKIVLEEKEAKIQKGKNDLQNLQTVYNLQNQLYVKKLSEARQDTAVVRNQLGYQEKTLVERKEKILKLEAEVASLQKQIKKKDEVLQQKELALQSQLNLSSESRSNTSTQNEDELLQLRLQIEEQQNEIRLMREQEQKILQDFAKKETEFKISMQQQEQLYQQSLQEKERQVTEKFEAELQKTKTDFEHQLKLQDLKMERLEAIIRKLDTSTAEENKRGYSPTVFSHSNS